MLLRLLKISLLALVAILVGCREEDIIYIPEEVEVAGPEYAGEITGFFLLNEGNMNENKATLDLYSYKSGRYQLNIFPKFNPNEVMDLGDVGNDMQIYGDRLYIVVNASKKVEVVDRRSVKKIGQIEIPNCRYIAFHKQYAYVTSYVGPIALDGEKIRQRGAVLKVDTASLKIVDTCYVGRQPDGIAIAGGKIFVANSGGYDPSDYERTVSVIDIESFREEERVDIAINLHHIKCDRRGVLWISSRGSYYGEHSNLYAYDTRKRRVVATMNIPVGNMWMQGDSLYTISSEWSYISEQTEPATYKIIDTEKMMIVNDRFITDGTEADIMMPYGIAVNPVTRDIIVTDAMHYYDQGWVNCYGIDGVRKWRVKAGQIPAHVAFY